jgi:hypothetical protein
VPGSGFQPWLAPAIVRSCVGYAGAFRRREIAGLSIEALAWVDEVALPHFFPDEIEHT